MSELEPAPLITVVVVTWQGRHLLEACLRSLQRQTIPHRILVVDNGSSDGTLDYLAQQHPDVEVVANARNLGFAGGVATAVPLVRTPYLALLNNDACAEPTWLEALLAHAQRHPEAAAVASRMLLADRPAVLNNAGVVLVASGHGSDRGLGSPATAYDTPGEVFGFSGGAALLRTSPLQGVGGFPAPFFLYYEDTDVSWRLRLAGWTVRYEPDAVVSHRHSATVDQASDAFAFFNERNRLLMLVRCAPAGMAARVTIRFLVTTVALVVRRLLGQDVPDVPTFRFKVRAHAFASWLRLLPWAVRSRRQILRTASLPTAAVTATWVGRYS